jgi:hypothetical protein
MRLLPVQFCHVSFFFIPVSPKCLPQHPFLENPVPIFCFKCDRPSSTSGRIMAVLVLMSVAYSEVADGQTGRLQIVPCC